MTEYEEQDLIDKQAIERARLIRRFTNKIEEQGNLASRDSDLVNVQGAVKRQLDRAIRAQQEELNKELEALDKKHLSEWNRSQSKQADDDVVADKKPEPFQLLPEEIEAKERRARIDKIMANSAMNNEKAQPQKQLSLAEQLMLKYKENRNTLDEGQTM